MDVEAAPLAGRVYSLKDVAANFIKLCHLHHVLPHCLSQAIPCGAANGHAIERSSGGRIYLHLIFTPYLLIIISLTKSKIISKYIYHR